jgi:hypothetical protein
MTEPLTNAIHDLILHLIRCDLVGNRRAAPCWVPPCWTPAHRQHRRPRGSRPRATTPPPQYRPMEPSPPRALEPSLPRPSLPPFGVPCTPRSQVDFGWLARPPAGITSFTMATPRSTPTIEEQDRESSVVEPLTRCMVDLTINDRLTTPFHQPDPPSLTPEEANPNPNGLSSGSPPRISSLGNRVLHWVI